MEFFLGVAVTYGTLSFAEVVYKNVQYYKVRNYALRQLSAFEKDKITFVTGVDTRGISVTPAIVHAIGFRSTKKPVAKTPYGIIICLAGTPESELSSLRASAQERFGPGTVCEFIYV